MPDQVKGNIEKIKAEIAEWPKDQKGSFVGGIEIGLFLAALIAKQVGCDIIKDKDFDEFTKFLDRNCSPIKRRNQTAQQSKPVKDQIFEDIKELLRRSIACRLRIPKDTFDTSLDTGDIVNKWLLIVVAIARRNELDAAIHDIQILRSIAGGGAADRESIRTEVETCHEKFPIEIAAVERFDELSKRNGFELKDIWFYFRQNVELHFDGYEDDELALIDAKYQ